MSRGQWSSPVSHRVHEAWTNDLLERLLLSISFHINLWVWNLLLGLIFSIFVYRTHWCHRGDMTIRAKAVEVYKCEHAKLGAEGARGVKLIMRRTSKLRPENKLLPHGHKTIWAMRQYADKAHQMPVVRQRGRGEWTSTCLYVCVCAVFTRDRAHDSKPLCGPALYWDKKFRLTLLLPPLAGHSH